MRGSEIDIVHQNVARLYRTPERGQIVSYTRTWPDCIIHQNVARLYRTPECGQIVSYTRPRLDCIVHGLQWREGRKRKRGSPMYLRSSK